jgi:hypothetical protein
MNVRVGLALAMCGVLALSACGSERATGAIGIPAASNAAAAQSPSVTPSSIGSSPVTQSAGSATPSVPAGSALAGPPEVFPNDVWVLGPSGTRLTAGSEIPPAYEAVVSVAITPHHTGAVAGAPAPSNGEYEVASVSVQVQSGLFSYDVSRLAFQTPAGHIYMPEDGNAPTSGYNSGPLFATLTAGQHFNARVAFDVPSGGGEVVYRVGIGRDGWTVPS